MEPARVRVLVICFCYGGNGGTSTLSPELALWLLRNLPKIKADPRVAAVSEPLMWSDTPITMMRNRAVKFAREQGFDMVLMLDNDNIPDGYLQPGSDAKPFWDEAFGFAYDRLIQGIPTVVAAPYCGPPPPPVDTPGVIHHGEVPYIFQWTSRESDNPHSRAKLEMFTRTEAARLSGIYPIAAAPTGCCLFTINVFNGMKPPHFYYEMDDEQTEKRSTEDVTCTRDISLFWKITKGIDVLFGAMDSWALHVKPKHVGRPQFVPIETVGELFADAIRDNHSGYDRTEYVDFTHNLPLAGGGIELRDDQNQVVVSDDLIAQRLREDAERDGQGARNDDTDIDEDDTPPPTEEDQLDTAQLQAKIDAALDDVPPEKSNGHSEFQRQRKIGDRLVTVLGREISDDAIHNITALADWVVDNRDGMALDAAVIHSDTGQSAAAILGELPDGSHLYCLDNLRAREYGLDKASHFEASFASEIASGRVMHDIEGRNFPMPHQPADMDLVFIERYVTREWLEIWKRHLKPDGVLAGYAGTEQEQKTVREFAEANGLLANISEGVFAVPLKLAEHA